MRERRTMFSGWPGKRGARGRSTSAGWGPPHPPPEPLIGVQAVPEAGARRSSRQAARTVALISGAALGAAVLVSIAVLTTVLPSTGSTRGTRSPAVRPSARAPVSGGTGKARSTLTALNAIVDQTGRGRQKVIAAIDAVRACSMNPADGQAAIGDVVAERHLVLAQLRRLGSSPSTGHADGYVIESLMAVIDDSVQADQDYAAWMADVGSGQPSCRVDPINDANFSAGQIFSAKADTDKQVFVQAWNPLAGSAGLSTYSPQDF